jgi:hypothetical protein
MLNVKDRRFGKEISLKNRDGEMGANAMISQFLNMKKRYKRKLGIMIEDDHHANRYFCNNDCAYIFSVEILEAIVKAIKDKNKDGALVLFQGLRKETKKEGKGKGICGFGRPTLIATAYVKDIDENKKDVLKRVQIPWEKAVDNDTDGFEHPGDGTGGNLLFFSEEVTDSDITVPVVTPGTDNDDTDYMIKDELTENDAIGWH